MTEWGSKSEGGTMEVKGEWYNVEVYGTDFEREEKNEVTSNENTEFRCQWA